MSGWIRRCLGLLFRERSASLPYAWFSGHEVRCLFDLSPAGPGPAAAVDDATWSDLQGDRYLAQVAADSSIFGRQWLYRRLRRVADAEPLEPWVRAADDTAGAGPLFDGSLMLPLRAVDIEPATALHGPAGFRPPPWVAQLWLIPLLLLVALLLAWFSFPSGILLGVAGVLASGWAQIRLHQQLQRWLRVRQMVVTMLCVAGRLRSHFDRVGWPAESRLPGARAALSQAERLLALFRPTLFESLPAWVEYANLVALHEYRRQRGLVRQFEREQQALRDIFAVVGRLEALGCLVRHLRQQPTLCWSTRVDDGLRFDGLVSPLLPQATEVDVALDGQGILLTGKNGVGKSTLLRSVGLNVLTAGAFGFCYARSAACAPFQVLTSMQLVDAPERGQSTYMAELARAGQLLDASLSRPRTLVLIDELFAGTNPLESIAAGATLLATLCERSAVIVATHEVVLARLLDGRLRPLCLLADPTDRATLHLAPGLIAETNGIAMMGEHGFPQALIQQAQALHERLSGSLSAPAAAPVQGAAGG